MIWINAPGASRPHIPPAGPFPDVDSIPAPAVRGRGIFVRSGSREAAAITLRVQAADIADYLGLTKETVSRVLAILKDRRLIRLAALDAVEILGSGALATLAEGGAD